MFPFVQTSIVSMQSIFCSFLCFFSVLLSNWMPEWMANVLTNRSALVLLLFYYYFIWIDLNEMICIATNPLWTENATRKPCDIATEAKKLRTNKKWPGNERVTIACQIEWKMYEKIIEIVIIIITRAESFPFLNCCCCNGSMQKRCSNQMILAMIGRIQLRLLLLYSNDNASKILLKMAINIRINTISFFARLAIQLGAEISNRWQCTAFFMFRCFGIVNQ